MKNSVSSNIFPRWASPALVCLFALTAALHAETGTIKGDRCNVRARPDTKSEVVVQLNKGDTVEIQKQKSTEAAKNKDWLQIALPASAACYVSSKFVSGGAIVGDDVYARSGPGTNFRDLGKLPKGEKVTVIGTKGEWTQIKPTSHCSAWISADLVKINEPVAAPIPAVTPAPIAPAEPVAANTSAPAIVPVTPAPAPAPAPAAAPEVRIKSTGPAEYVQYTLRVGVLNPVANPANAPASYELLTPENNRISHRICYLDTTDMNLSRYNGKKVRVFGNLRWREKDRDPVMIVERVDLIW
jgi:hypothetical protein